MLIDQGIIYCATGSTYIDECYQSCLRLRQFLPNISVILFTDQPNNVLLPGPFDFVYKHPNPSFSYRDKILILSQTPFYYTLFLDTDATPIYDINYIFSMLDNFDICASYAPVRIPDGWQDTTVPLSFPEFNTGVLLYRKSTTIVKLFESWLSLYDSIYSDFGQTWDQASFRSCLWTFFSSNYLNFHNLPSEFNFRTTKPWIAGKGLPVQILHGRIPENEWLLLLSYLNGNISSFRSFNEWYKLYPESSIRIKPL